MAYLSLYRKYRPQRFSDVVGQEAIIKAIGNQIVSEKTTHAYLFTGTRGTGKTTVAKIFARAVNCENVQPDGSPCCECAACRGISDGSFMNVIEIDAASNNGVDNVRTIIEEIAYRPPNGKKKVYIIDEVHMLHIPSPFFKFEHLKKRNATRKIIPYYTVRCIEMLIYPSGNQKQKE